MRRAVAIAALLAAAYLLVAPESADLAAQLYRAELFDRHGWLLWDNAWYGGHPLPGYSVLFPPLGALLGVRVVGALSVVAAAALFALLAREAFPPRRAALGATAFAALVAAQLLTGRMTFLLGVALGLGALLAARRRHAAVAILAAIATTLASPVAGAFLALAAVAWAAAQRRVAPLALGAAAIVPGLVLAVLFPEGGTEPFVASAFWPAFVALAALAALLPAEHRALRIGAALAAAACLAAFVIPTPLGGNATRLGALFAAPLLVCVPLSGARRTAALVALPLLAYWALMPPLRDAITTTGDPATEASYYAPLLRRLAGEAPARVEVPFTRSHWEARHLAPHVALARGWERQVDRERNALFYEGELTPARLRAWLQADAVRWVALPDVALDPSAKHEAALLRAGVPGVREVWRSAHWRLYRVAAARPLGATALAPDAFSVRRPGIVRVRWSPYWAVVSGAGCVARAPGGWTRVTGIALRVAQRFSLSRGVGRSSARRCRGLEAGRAPG